MNGRPLKYINVDSTIKVLDLIPEDGTCIRFKELKKRCREHGITHRILLRDLKRLEDTGTVVKEAVKTERGAGTCYRRTVFLHLSPFIPGDIQTFTDFISVLKDHVESCKKESCAAKAVHNALYVLFLTVYDELVEYTRNPDKELAEKRLSSVLKDFILPMVMKTTELAALPGACSELAQVALDCAHAKSLKDWDKIIWKCAASIKGDYDYDTLKKKLEELEKVSPQEEEHKSNPDST